MGTHYSHPPSSTYFWKGSWQMPEKIMKALSALEQNNHQSPLCWWHRRLSRRGTRTGKISWVSRQSLHSLQHGDQCWEDQADDNQYQLHQHRDQSKWTVTSFKCLGSVITYEGSKPEIHSRIEQTTEASTRLKPICNGLGWLHDLQVDWLTDRFIDWPTDLSDWFTDWLSGFFFWLFFFLNEWLIDSRHMG